MRNLRILTAAAVLGTLAAMPAYADNFDSAACGASNDLNLDEFGNTLTGGSIGVRATASTLGGEEMANMSDGFGNRLTGSGHLGDAVDLASEPVHTAAGLGAVSDVDKIDNSQSG